MFAYCTHALMDTWTHAHMDMDTWTHAHMDTWMIPFIISLVYCRYLDVFIIYIYNCMQVGCTMYMCRVYK
jgi:hypothetical protein